MKYNLKRALALSLGLYAATFVVGIVAGVVSKQDMSSLNNIGDWFWYVGMISAVVVTSVFTLWYYKNRVIVRSAKSGLLFGLTAAAVCFLLDFILISIGNADSANVDLTNYYGDYRYWLIFLLVVVTAKVVGHVKRKKTA